MLVRTVTLWFLLSVSKSMYAQPIVASCEECSRFKYPFRICPGNEIICASNPYIMPPPAKFNQVCLPATVFANPLAGPAESVDNTLHGEENIYLRADFQYKLSVQWTGACGSIHRQGCKPCPYVIAYWREPEGFDDHLRHFAETSVRYEGDCTRDCFGSGTRLNWASDFTMRSGVTGHPKRGFYMNISPSYSVSGNNHLYFHLRTVVSHEFGHFLGFAGYKEVLCPPMTSENTSNCFMNDNIGYEEERDNPCLWENVSLL